jgi:dihydropyrimidinase
MTIGNEYDLVIHSGKLVNADQTLDADLGILGEKIVAIGQNLNGRRVIDASGLLVLPGAVDPHVHLEMPVGTTRSSDDWYTGTCAAAYGGTTTIIDFVEPAAGESLTHALSLRRELAKSKSVIDFGLHITITNDDPQTLDEISSICQDGCTSFKTYRTYDGFKLSDTAFLNVLTAVRSAGGVVLVHAENDAIIGYLKRQFRTDKQTDPIFHARSRPAIAEGEAIQRSLAMAEVTGARLYIVHISTALGEEALIAARKRGVKAYGETCPQYLLLTERELMRPDFEGAKFVCSPPLRTDADRERLWQGLSVDDIQTVGTDHCPFNFHGQKNLGRHNYEDIPGGLPGIETRLALLYQFGVRSGRMSLNRWVEVCCANPARIFGLFPRKGALQPGADADIVLFDPGKKVTITKSILHEQVDYTPYEGFELQGYPVMTLLRGQMIVENSTLLPQPGSGHYLTRLPGESIY